MRLGLAAGIVLCMGQSVLGIGLQMSSRMSLQLRIPEDGGIR